MACKQELFILISCIFLNVFCYELQFEGCGISGWNCSNKTNGKIDVVFKCPHELLKEKPNILWGFKGLPASAQAVTIEDCETSISVTVETLLVASGKYPNLSSFVIKNIAELIINESTFSIPELLRGAAAVKFENIKLITSFNKNSIGGNVFSSGNGISMTSFNFEMKNVQINDIKNRAIWWTEGEIPFTMLWNNVSVNVVEEDAIHISDTKKNPNSKITINNCKLGEIKRKAFNIHSTDFQFTDNDVDSLEKSAFRIQSGRTTFIRNNFFKINNFAFLFVNVGTGEKNLKFESNTIHQADKLSMNFGAPYYNEVQGKVSFRDNKFNCINSTWLQRGENEKIETKGGEEEEVQYYKYLKKIEKSVLDSNENTCINLPCSITVSKFKDLYAKNGPMKSYCN